MQLSGPCRFEAGHLHMPAIKRRENSIVGGVGYEICSAIGSGAQRHGFVWHIFCSSGVFNAEERRKEGEKYHC